MKMLHLKRCPYTILLLFLVFFSKSQYTDEEVLLEHIRIQPMLSQQPDSAVFFARKVLRNNSNKEIRVHTYINMSIAKGFLGEKDSAIYFGTKARENALKLKKPDIISRACGNLSSQYRRAVLYSLAKEEAKRGLFYTNKITNLQDHIWIEAGLLRELAKINELQQNNDSTFFYLNKALLILENSKEKNAILIRFTYSSIYNDLAKYYIQEKKIKKAEENAKKAIKASKGLPYQELALKNAYLNLSYIYLYKNEVNRAIDTLKIIEKKTSPNEFPLRKEIYNALAKSYTRLGDTENYRKYAVLSESVENKLDTSELKAINRSISVIEENNISITKKNRRNKYIIIGVSTISIILIISMLNLYRTKRKEKKIFESYIQKNESEKTLTRANLDIKFEKENNNPNVEKSTTKISTDIENSVLEKLCEFEKEKKFNDTNTTLYKLSNEFEVNTKYLSEIILKYKGQYFNNYINQLRINDICQKIIENPEYRKYKISYLAEISGFSSGEIFARIFKKTTGISPSVFIKNASIMKNLNETKP